MRMLIAAAGIAVITSLIGACSGSSSGNAGGDGGSTSSSGGATSGSCNVSPGTYMFHWTTASGGSMCPPLPDHTQIVDPSKGITMTAAGDAGSCPVTTTDCSSSADCTLAFGDSGFEQISESFSVNQDGSITGMMSITSSITLGGATMMLACTYTLTGTRQP